MPPLRLRLRRDFAGVLEVVPAGSRTTAASFEWISAMTVSTSPPSRNFSAARATSCVPTHWLANDHIDEKRGNSTAPGNIGEANEFVLLSGLATVEAMLSALGRPISIEDGMMKCLRMQGFDLVIRKAATPSNIKAQGMRTRRSLPRFVVTRAHDRVAKPVGKRDRGDEIG